MPHYCTPWCACNAGLTYQTKVVRPEAPALATIAFVEEPAEDRLHRFTWKELLTICRELDVPKRASATKSQMVWALFRHFGGDVPDGLITEYEERFGRGGAG